MLEFRGRHRELMLPDRWTELFFLDEATAFSAGHRPCFQCRYAAHQQFKSAWLKGNPQFGFTEKTSIHEIDNILKQERIDKKGSKVKFEADIQTLPNGTFIQLDDLLICWHTVRYTAGQHADTMRGKHCPKKGWLPYLLQNL